MSSRCRPAASVLALCVLLLAACEREERAYRGEPVGEVKPGHALCRGAVAPAAATARV